MAVPRADGAYCLELVNRVKEADVGELFWPASRDPRVLDSLWLSHSEALKDFYLLEMNIRPHRRVAMSSKSHVLKLH